MLFYMSLLEFKVKNFTDNEDIFIDKFNIFHSYLRTSIIRRAVRLEQYKDFAIAIPSYDVIEIDENKTATITQALPIQYNEMNIPYAEIFSNVAIEVAQYLFDDSIEVTKSLVSQSSYDEVSLVLAELKQYIDANISVAKSLNDKYKWEDIEKWTNGKFKLVSNAFKKDLTPVRITTSTIYERNPLYDLILGDLTEVIDSLPLAKNRGSIVEVQSIYNLIMNSISSVNSRELFEYHIRRLYERGLILSPDYITFDLSLLFEKGFDTDSFFKKIYGLNVFVYIPYNYKDGLAYLQQLDDRVCAMLYRKEVHEETRDIFSNNPMETETSSDIQDILTSIPAVTAKPYTIIGHQIDVEKANRYMTDTIQANADMLGIDYYQPILFNTKLKTVSLLDIEKLKYHNNCNLTILAKGFDSTISKYIKNNLVNADTEFEIPVEVEASYKGNNFITRTIQKFIKPNIEPKIEYKTIQIPKSNMNDSEETDNTSLDKLNQLIGLEKVKETLHEITSVIKANRLYKENGIKEFNEYFHMVFYGNPGTAKTTIARLCADIFYKEGLLQNNRFTEYTRVDLVGQYVGHTAEKVKEKLLAGRGGVIFIDEAYSLTAAESPNDYGTEVVNTLVTMMEDLRKDTIIILAGYKDDMTKFLKSNQGLSSRIMYNLEFDNYTKEQLVDILKSMASDYKFELSNEYIERFITMVSNVMYDKGFGNGRYVRNIFTKSIILHSSRIVTLENPTQEQLRIITLDDYPSDTTLQVSNRKIGFGS